VPAAACTGRAALSSASIDAAAICAKGAWRQSSARQAASEEGPGGGGEAAMVTLSVAHPSVGKLTRAGRFRVAPPAA